MLRLKTLLADMMFHTQNYWGVYHVQVSQKYIFSQLQGIIMQIEIALINDRLRVSKVS